MRCGRCSTTDEGSRTTDSLLGAADTYPTGDEVFKRRSGSISLNVGLRALESLPMAKAFHAICGPPVTPDAAWSARKRLPNFSQRTVARKAVGVKLHCGIQERRGELHARCFIEDAPGRLYCAA